MLNERLLTSQDIPLFKLIDRAELIEAFYRLQDGQLLGYPQREVVTGWPPGEAEHDARVLQACEQRGGWLYGVFDEHRLVAAAVVDCLVIHNAGLRLRQLKFLHVSQAYRGRGLGQRLFGLAAEQARRMGGEGLYVSATPSRNTVDFYRRLGCELLAAPDPELYRLEPEDIHLYLRLP
ncbi:GNAT family N-acetyltransferase [Pseudomonas sp. GW456-L14]|uniref:GNAT family N-acetyltransferase n=1 Tax=Pseudomonas chlororaphis TaxID=587753 RepID=A0AB34C975_9PSED|nr:MULTISPECIES: GNAT family N-acetyltransferase [Pseudomonas]KAA5843836.1 GNAT family N-acetyltransferase [Pseudomonas chlororaphis]PMY39948.1 GNAT family N-acetyltransferase [Pseudomonas sp. GW456-L14]PMY57376.1 GNAT family N-acetyltransferase [Pseudomonas sp. GW456-L12]